MVPIVTSIIIRIYTRVTITSVPIKRITKTTIESAISVSAITITATVAISIRGTAPKIIIETSITPSKIIGRVNIYDHLVIGGAPCWLPGISLIFLYNGFIVIITS
jgi:hypothetical protein